MAKHRKPAGTYHHGDLREALLAEALKVVEQQGLANLSLRELARRLGVSSAAPYHHFTDRTALLRALADHGFERLEECMREELDKVGPRAGERLLALGRGYLRFATQHPSHFRLMFRPDWMPDPSCEPEPGSAAFELLREVVTACLAELGREAMDPMPSILAMWGGVHGIAALRLDGPLRRMSDVGAVDALCDEALVELGRGLTVNATR